jgi:hypothetical protein
MMNSEEANVVCQAQKATLSTLKRNSTIQSNSSNKPATKSSSNNKFSTIRSIVRRSIQTLQNQKSKYHHTVNNI